MSIADRISGLAPTFAYCAFIVSTVLIPLDVQAGPTEAGIYDDFQAKNLNTDRWSVKLPKKARHATTKVQNGDMCVYGNGHWAYITSKQQWQLPTANQEGLLQFTFKIRPWQRGKYGEINLQDSKVLLVGEDSKPQGEQDRLIFGFGITFKNYSGGNYLLYDGKAANIRKSAFPYTNDMKKYDYLRLSLGRNSNGTLCELAASKDGKTWQVLRTSSPVLPKAVRVSFMSNWGNLAVGEVAVTMFDVKGQFAKAYNVAKPKKVAKGKAKATPAFIPVMYISDIKPGQRPMIDGKLNDAVWKESPRVELKYVAPKWPAPVTQQTEAYVCYDKDNLYVAFSCDEDAMERVWAVHKTGGPIWSDDCVELFVQPEPLKRPSNLFHAAVNSLAQKVDESGLQAQWTCAAVRGGKNWTVEMAIPFSVIGKTPKPGECWGINFNRQERPHGENSTWGPVRRTFHDRERYGRIVFGGSPVRIEGFAPVTQAGAEGGGILVKLSADKGVAGDVKIASKWDRGKWQGKTVAANTKNVLLPWPKSLTPGYHSNALKLDLPSQKPLVIAGGKMWIDQGVPLSSVFWPQEDYDNILYMANGRMNYLHWLVSDTRGGPGGYTATIEAPEWVEVYPLAKKGQHGHYAYMPNITDFKSEKIKKDGRVIRRITIKTSSPPISCKLSKVAEYKAPFKLWMRADAPAKTKLPLETKLKYWVTRNGLSEPVHEIPLILLPRIEGKQPKRFPIFAWTNGPTYPEHIWKELAEHYSNVGLNGLMGAPYSKEFEKAASAVNLKTINYCFGFPHSNYYIKKHPKSAAIQFDGKKSKSLVCPELSLEENSAAFAWASAMLDKYCPSVGLSWDLEGPPIWSVCFCDRCLNAFRKHKGLSDDYKLSPKIIRSNPELSKAWEDFALEQSKRMAIKWDKRIAKARPGARLYINGGQATNPRVRTDGRLDWTRVLPHIGAGQMFRYINSPQASATSFHKESLNSLDIAKRASDTPMMAVLTTGYMRVGERMVFDYPKLTTLQMVQMAAIGFDGIYYWHWYNNDARFDNAIARGTTIIAEHEDFFVDGQKMSVPKDAVSKPKYTLVLGRKLNKRAILFVLNFDPNRQAEVLIDFEKLPTKKWYSYPAKTPVCKNSKIRIAPLDLVILLGEE